MGNSMAGSKVYMVAAAHSLPMPANAAAWAALTWVEIKGVGNMGEIGTKENSLSYPLWGQSVDDKAKGRANAGDPTLEVMRDTTDPGQDALRAAGLTNLHYVFKVERNDKLTGGGTNTLIYNRGLVFGPARPQGGSEDFDVEVFTLGFDTQREFIVDPT